MKQNYGSELRNETLASLKPEISQALGSLLDELRSIEDTKAMRMAVPHQRATPIVAGANLDDAPSCPASSAKPQVVHITLITWWIVVTYLTVTVDHGLGHAW